MQTWVIYQKYVNIFNIWKYTGCLNNYIQFMASAKFQIELNISRWKIKNPDGLKLNFVIYIKEYIKEYNKYIKYVYSNERFTNHVQRIVYIFI